MINDVQAHLAQTWVFEREFANFELVNEYECTQRNIKIWICKLAYDSQKWIQCALHYPKFEQLNSESLHHGLTKPLESCYRSFSLKLSTYGFPVSMNASVINQINLIDKAALSWNNWLKLCEHLSPANAIYVVYQQFLCPVVELCSVWMDIVLHFWLSVLP